MTEYIRITETTESWFLPLLPPHTRALYQTTLEMFAIGAVEDETACGVLLFYEQDDRVEIQYLIVADDYRRQGIGTGMVRYLCQSYYESETPVICVFTATGREDPLYLMFEEMGNFSVSEEDGYYCSISVSELQKNRKFIAMGAQKEHPVPFFSLPEREQKAFLNFLISENLNYLQDIDSDTYLRPLCLCCKNGSGIQAAVFVTQDAGSADADLSFVWGMPGVPRPLMKCLADVASMLPAAGVETLNIAAVTPSSVSLVEKLLDNKTITRRFYSAVWDIELWGGL